MVVELINDNEVLLRNFLGIIWDQSRGFNGPVNHNLTH